MLDQNQPLLRFTLLSDLLPAPFVLRHDPIGWEEMGVSLHRDAKYHGLTTEYTVEFGFVKDGRALLAQLLERAGPEAPVQLLVEVYAANEFVWQTYYLGRLELSGSSQTPTEFRCGAEKTGFTQRFLSREDTPVDLLGRESVGGTALPAQPHILVDLHSKAIRQRYEARAPASPTPALPSYVTDGESRFKTMYFGFGESVVDEFGVSETNAGTVTIKTGSVDREIPIYTTKERGLFDFDIAIEALLRVERRLRQGKFEKVDGVIFFRINKEPTTELLRWADSDIATREGEVGEYRKLLVFSHRVQRELEIGDKIYLYGDMNVHDISGPLVGPYNFPVTLQLQQGSYFLMEADTQTVPTPAAGMLAYEVLDRLAQALTDSPAVAFRSDFFGRTDTSPAYPIDGPGSLLLLTGGFQVRGFPLAVRSIYASWKPALDSLNAAYWLGVGIERLPLAMGGNEIVRVESASYFYADTLTLELAGHVADALPDADGTLVSNLKLRELPDRTYLSVKAGWQKWQTGSLNGLDEFNASREWSLPLECPTGAYEAVGGYIASGFYLESTRRQRHDATATTDDRADNDNFLVCLLRAPGRTASGFETERDQRFAQVQGVYSPATVYNLRLSPARMLRRHGPALAAGLRFSAADKLRFRFGEGNNTLLTRLPGESTVVAERVDVPVTELGPPLWRAQAWEFTAPCTRQQAAQVLAAPRGRIRFRDSRGQVQEGWIIDFKHTLASAEAQFTLLRCHALSAAVSPLV